MNKLFSRKQLTLAVSCALALGVASGAATAETDPADTAYLKDQRGNVVMSGSGLCWHSGTGPAPVSTPECDPNYVAAAPPIIMVAAPAPAPVAAAPAAPKPLPIPVAQRVTLDADTLFDFNKADLRPAGRAALDDFIVRSKDINPEVIMAVGHADRLGSNAYNQQLSEQRAAAVKTYLLTQGIDANRVQTEGRGETQPATTSAECSGAKSSKVIACLQPDRRVDIEVIGNRIVN